MKDKVELTDEEQAEISTYLVELRDSGRTNMYGAIPYIEAELGYPRDKAEEGWNSWVASFND